MFKLTCHDCGKPNPEWKHTYYIWLSICEACHSKKGAASLGSIKTERKSATSRENGRKGGRPPKMQPDAASSIQ